MAIKHRPAAGSVGAAVSIQLLAVSGRGLQIIDALAQAWGVRDLTATKQLWFRRRVGRTSSVQRALRVLDVVSDAEEGVPAKAVARRAGLHLSTTYHLLNTLVHEGYLVRLGDKQGFGVGYKIPVLYRQLRRHLDLPPEQAAVVADVHHQAQAATYYAGFRNGHIVLAHMVDSPRCPCIDLLAVGFAESAHATAFGKLMLASLTPAARCSYLATHGMPQLTPLTVTDRWELEAELVKARVHGLVAEVEEFQLRSASLATPVHDRTGAAVGAIAVSVPAGQFEQHQTHLAHILHQGATRASALLT